MVSSFYWEIKDGPANRGSTLAACLPRGCCTSCLWQSDSGRNVPPRCTERAEEAIKYPLKTAGTFSDSHYWLIKQKDVRDAGDKRRVSGLLVEGVQALLTSCDDKS